MLTRISCSASVLWVTMSLSVLFAQSPLPPGSIDGAVHPEQIPDVLAFRLFLGAIAESTSLSGTLPTNASSVLLRPSARQAAKLLPVQLNPSDTSVLLQVLGDWEGKMSGARPMAAGTPAPVDLDGMAQSSVSALERQMSPQGFTSLIAYVRSQKKYMKRIPVPDMSQHSH